MKTLLKLLLLTPAALLAATPVPTEIVPAKISGAKPRNVVFILSDDHRYDAMSFMDHQFAKTPVMDSLAANGAHIKNALVTTALCSPSRASILTGLYTFRHRVIDNNRAIPKGTRPYSDHIVPHFIPQRPYDYLYWEFHEKEGRVAIRKGNWKGVRYGVATDPNSPLSCMTSPRIQVRRTTSPHRTPMSSASWMPCSKEGAPFHPSPNSTSPKGHGHPIRTSDRPPHLPNPAVSLFPSGLATRSFNGLQLKSKILAVSKPMNRTILIVILMLVPLQALHAAERLNVLLIMADDLRDYGGAFTREAVKTPNLDRLRQHGTTFERAYVQYPVCNPSRASMMTGLRAEQTGIVGNDISLRDKNPDIVTLPQLCKDSGWQSHAFGKLFHLGGDSPESKQAWMDAGKSWQSAQTFEATKLGRKILEGRNVTAGSLPWCAWGAADGDDDDQPDGQIAAATVAMIDKLGDTPWFIGCGFMKPHDPFIAPKKYFDLYPLDSLKLWHDPADMTPVRKEAVGFASLGKAFAKFTDKEWRELFRAYCAGTSFMDAQLGRVLDVLDKNKLWDKTIVIFVGDHGYHTGERQWWNKDTLFERSCRAPLIIAAPGMENGQVSRSLVEFVDLYPTVADYCALKIPHAVAGKSLRRVLEKPDAVVKESAFTLISRGPKLYGQSLRTSRWRFTRWSDGQTELYDHDNDPEEIHNVAEKHAAVVKKLTDELITIGKLKS